MPILNWHCSVCGGNYNNKRRWLRHFLKDKHQELARKRLPNWEGKERSCVLTLFAKLPVGKDDKIIQYLSKHFGTIVTDFVWWEERPRIGFVRFESRDKANGILASLNKNQVQIDPDQICNVREAKTIPELEWKELFPHKNVPSTLSPPPPTSQIIDIHDSPVQQPNSAEGVPLKRMKRETLEDDSGRAPNEGRPLCPSISFSPARANKFHGSRKEIGLRHHLKSIQRLADIPTREHNLALKISSQIQQVLNNSGRGRVFLYKVDISRQWILTLMHSPFSQFGNSPCSILIHKYSLMKSSSDFDSIQPIQSEELKTIEKLLTTQQQKNRKTFLSYEACSIARSEDDEGYGALRYTIKAGPSPRDIFLGSLETSPGHLVELQVWRLFKYLCTFDPHCHPVMSIAYYWARINSVSFGMKKASSISPLDLPDPVCLNWLLILFFQQEGLIPSAKSILELPHPALTVLKTDIGFSESTEFEFYWRDKMSDGGPRAAEDEEGFAEEVFTLLYKFFQFCTSRFVEGGGWILNTRDGEILPLGCLQSASETVKSLTREELTEINKKYNWENRGSSCERIIMLHPFNINWRISTSNVLAAFEAMKETEMKMKDYFSAAVDGNVQKSNLEFNDVLNLLKIQAGKYKTYPDCSEKLLPL